METSMSNDELRDMVNSNTWKTTYVVNGFADNKVGDDWMITIDASNNLTKLNKNSKPMGATFSVVSLDVTNNVVAVKCSLPTGHKGVLYFFLESSIKRFTFEVKHPTNHTQHGIGGGRA
ncbi:MAG: hypothetical protein ACJAYN_000786 [Bermanella sp.]|jgi:hypothetical protein